MSGSVYQIRNVRTGKCLTIAGGVSDANNLQALQFDCDSHPSRTWRINDVTGSGINQISNVQTGKCVTIAGGTIYRQQHPRRSVHLRRRPVAPLDHPAEAVGCACEWRIGLSAFR